MDIVRLEDLRGEFKKYWRKDKVDFLQNYFKKDQTQTKDIFRGVSVPHSKKIAKQFINLDFNDIQTLLESEVHEERLIAVFILDLKYQRADETTKEQIAKFYLRHKIHIDTWDLVDSSASRILGNYLLDQDRVVLYELAGSDKWFERRIAIIATLAFIVKNHEYQDTFKIAEILLGDKQDLIHKAVGWMLREIGKRISPEVEKQFLDKHYKKMPRTMLRYAIEHFSLEERKHYLSKA